MVTLVGKNKLNNQRGFSLVELMVVVAIIGVLAAIAVPNISKYIAKARQSEAKTNLSSLYTSEKAFYAEYTAYDTRFDAIGYSPEGQLRYNVGFSANHFNAGAGNGYNGGGTAAFFNTVAYCGAAGALTRGCTILNGATGAAPDAITGSLATVNTFTASSAAIIMNGNPAVADRWAITHEKILSNTTSGIP